MRIYKSPFPDVAISEKSVTERVFDGVNLEDAVLIDRSSGRKVSGAEFVKSVQSLSGGLAARGFGVGNVLALMAPNVPEYCVVFHAAAWAGGTVTTI